MPKKRPPLVDRDDHLIRFIILVTAMFAGAATGKIILDAALRFGGPL